MGGRRRLGSAGSERPLRSKEWRADLCPLNGRCELGRNGDIYVVPKRFPTNCLSRTKKQYICNTKAVDCDEFITWVEPRPWVPICCFEGHIHPRSHRQKAPDIPNPRSILKLSWPVDCKEVKAISDSHHKELSQVSGDRTLGTLIQGRTFDLIQEGKEGYRHSAQFEHR